MGPPSLWTESSANFCRAQIPAHAHDTRSQVSGQNPSADVCRAKIPAHAHDARSQVGAHGSTRPVDRIRPQASAEPS